MRWGRTVVGAQARRRWGVVLAVVVVLCAIPVAINVWPARAADISVPALRARITASGGQAYSGYAQSTGLLPLPPLPNLERVTALVSGTTEIRAWYAGPDRWRVDVIAGGSERDTYQAPDGQYVWDYEDNQLSRIVGAQPLRLPRAADLTPPELVRRIFASAAGDRFEPVADKRVAGRAAAGLRIIPATADTTVDHVDVWADPVSGLPVQAEVTAKGGVRPVFVTRFLELHLGAPDASVVAPPQPRPGIGYTETTAPDVLSLLNRRARFVSLPDELGGSARAASVPGVTAAAVYGTGLARFVVAALPGRIGSPAYDKVETFGQSVTVPRGTAALIATGLLTVLVVRADRTYLVTGLVAPALLERVAVDLAGAVT
ncbi:MAG TPA: hypothetical protein VH502_06475 [Actinoplanes sp.]